MPRDGFVLAVSPKGQKRRVPKSWLEEPFNYKLPSDVQSEDTSGSEVASGSEKKISTQKGVSR